jgi:hypothetical protein
VKITSGSIISVPVSDPVSKALDHVAKAEGVNRLAWVQNLIASELRRLGYSIPAGQGKAA